MTTPQVPTNPGAAPTAPTATALPSQAGLPAVGATTANAAPGTLAWVDQTLNLAQFAYGQNTPVNEQGYVQYNGQVMTTAEANTQYQADLAAYNSSQAQKSNHVNDIQGPTENFPQPTAPSTPVIDQMVLQYVGKQDPTDLTNLQRQLQAGGFLTAAQYTPGVPDEDTMKAFGNLLQKTTEAMGNDPSATWQTVLGNSVAQSGWQVDAQGNMSRTVTKTPSINQASAQVAIQSLIGRNASASELQNFMKTYNNDIAGQLDTTETITKAGVDSTTAPTYATQAQTVQAAQLAAAQQNPDYATYQAATTYWNAMQQALGASGNVQNNLK